MRQGNGNGKSIRRRILFLEDSVTSKVVKSTRSNERFSPKKATIRSVQSYVPCESDSDKTEEDDHVAAFNKEKNDDENNVISFTTSNKPDDSPLNRNKINNTAAKGKQFKKRMHSNSAHEQMSSLGGSLKQGWNNLASSLLPTRLLDSAGIDG